MIDFDVHQPSRFSEDFLCSMQLKLRKDYEPIKVYISTSNPHNSFYDKFFNNTKLTEESE